jgi:hypothetical protein
MPDDDVNDRGELSFAAQVRMTHGPVAGTWRDSQPGEDEFWYDVPAGPPVLPLMWWQGVHPAHVDLLPQFSPGPLPAWMYVR